MAERRNVVMEVELSTGDFDTQNWSGNLYDGFDNLVAYITGTQPITKQFGVVPNILETAPPELSADDIVKLKSAGFDTQDLIRLNQHGII